MEEGSGVCAGGLQAIKKKIIRRKEGMPASFAKSIN
jgi:hypothetical protein